jgi:hypothetical protein
VSDQSFELDPLEEIRELTAAAAALAKNREAFDEAFAAFTAGDATRFQGVLDAAGVGDQCHRICVLFCEKTCAGRCLGLCPEKPGRPVDAAEVREFVETFTPVVNKRGALDKLMAAADQGDTKAWQAELKRLGLTDFCRQVCHFLCKGRCRLVCRGLCDRPVITRVSSMIAPDNFNALGFGQGPTLPPNQVPPAVSGTLPPPNAGNHPIGGTSTLLGVFNFPAAVKYRIEVCDTPSGTYSPITEDVVGWNNLIPPHLLLPRRPDGGGWFNIPNLVPPSPPVDPLRRGIFVSDGGPNAIGEKTLTNWTTSNVADGVWYLRLLAQDGGGSTRTSAPQKVVVDNTPPPTPVIKLQLKKPDGSLVDLKCGKVKRGDGLIRVTIQATDPNFSSCSVNAEGNSSLSVPVIASPDPPGTGPTVALSKNYNYDPTDTGYPVPTSFLWDPWSDPNIVSCCYIVRIDINDRSVINNSWQGGHGGAGWEAIEIGI